MHIYNDYIGMQCLERRNDAINCKSTVWKAVFSPIHDEKHKSIFVG